MYLPGLLNLDEANVLPKDGVLSYYYPFYDEDQAEFYFKDLMNNVKWRQDEMEMYDKVVPVPRLLSFYGINDEWPASLLEMKKDVEEHTKHKFNSVLLNLYRDQDDHVSWHSDKAKHPDDNKIIASLSLGEVRKFQLKHKTDHNLEMISLELKPGSLVVMNNIQEYWLHRIAPTKKVKGPRINLTFRNIT